MNNYILAYYQQIIDGSAVVGKWVRCLYEYIITGLESGAFISIPYFPQDNNGYSLRDNALFSLGIGFAVRANQHSFTGLTDGTDIIRESAPVFANRTKAHHNIIPLSNSIFHYSNAYFFISSAN